MKTKKMYNVLLKNGGLTLGLKAKNGFMVSLPTNEKVINNNLEEFKKSLKEYKKLYKQIKKVYKNAYIGLWIENGNIYLDFSLLINEYYKALQVGRKNNQLAIYNIEENKSIYL